jgi:hypothetical protein
MQSDRACSLRFGADRRRFNQSGKETDESGDEVDDAGKNQRQAREGRNGYELLDAA